MHFVVVRDDDTNALTRPEWLERLYRPFLAQGLRVQLAAIPEVRCDTRLPDGRLEGYLLGPHAGRDLCLPLGENPELRRYLAENQKGFQLIQHGLTHDRFEFDDIDRSRLAQRLERGRQLLFQAGFGQPQTFVAPQDRLSRAALLEVARRFSTLSSGWYQGGRLPWQWWPAYLGKKIRGYSHWRAGGLTLLTHPGCLLSRFRPREGMFDRVRRQILSHRLTILVTHWWEYFPEGQPDLEFIAILHQVANFLAQTKDIQVIGFDEVGRCLPV